MAGSEKKLMAIGMKCSSESDSLPSKYFCLDGVFQDFAPRCCISKAKQNLQEPVNFNRFL